MKTVKEWLETLPEPYRTQALNNAEQGSLSIEKPNLSGAIATAFFWPKSPEGLEYWFGVYDRYDHSTTSKVKKSNKELAEYIHDELMKSDFSNPDCTIIENILNQYR